MSCRHEGLLSVVSSGAGDVGDPVMFTHCFLPTQFPVLLLQFRDVSLLLLCLVDWPGL